MKWTNASLIALLLLIAVEVRGANCTLTTAPLDFGPYDPVSGAEVLGTARLRMFDRYGKAERVAVAVRARKAGVGRALMEALEVEAAAQGAAEMRLNAQVEALPFYRALSYSPEGSRFFEAGIEHIEMRKYL